MKKISTSKSLIKDDEFLSCNECEAVEIVEIEEGEFQCEWCNSNLIVSGMDLSQDFIWHPKRKY